MFRIECFVDDKKLGQMLNALVGLAIGQPGVTPVINATVKNGSIIAASNGDLRELFLKYAKTNHLNGMLAVAPIKAFLKSIGKSESSINYYIKQLVAAKAIKKHGKGTRMRYTVIK